MALPYRTDYGAIPMPNGVGRILGPASNNKFVIVDDKVIEIETILVYKHSLKYNSDIMLYIVDWMHNEIGEWVLNHVVEEPAWHTFLQPVTYEPVMYISAKMSAADATFFKLKWGDIRSY